MGHQNHSLRVSIATQLVFIFNFLPFLPSQPRTKNCFLSPRRSTLDTRLISAFRFSLHAKKYP